VDDVRDGVLVEDRVDRVEVGDVADDERDPFDLLGRHDQLETPMVRAEVERGDGRAVAHQGSDRPGTDASEGARDEESLSSHGRTIRGS